MEKKKEGFITKMFHYISGELHQVIEEFDRLEDAIEAGIKAAAHTYKVYDHDGRCHHDSRKHKRHNHYC